MFENKFSNNCGDFQAWFNSSLTAAILQNTFLTFKVESIDEASTIKSVGSEATNCVLKLSLISYNSFPQGFHALN